MTFTAKATPILVLVMVALNLAVTASAQATVEGPFYAVTEERLLSGETREVTDTAKSSFKLEAKSGIVISCTGTKSASGAVLDGSSGANPGTSTQTIDYTGCTVTGNGSSCKVEGEKIVTTSLKTTLGYATESREPPILEIVEPVSGTTIAEPKFGGTCTFASTKITGSAIGEAVSPEEETTDKELKFSKTSKKIWKESGGTLTSKTAGLEAFGTTATEEATEEVDTKQAVPILWNFSASLCNTAPAEGTVTCKALTYFGNGEEFKGQLSGEFKITDGANTIACTESTLKLISGENPKSPNVPAKVEAMTFGGCKLGAKACTLVAPKPGVMFPWEGSFNWIKIGTTGINGFLTMRTFSIKATCEGEFCVYEGAGLSKSVAAGIFNANDTNKPIATEQAVLQFKASLVNAVEGMCSGKGEVVGDYSLTPKEAGKKLYVAKQ